MRINQAGIRGSVGPRPWTSCGFRVPGSVGRSSEFQQSARFGLPGSGETIFAGRNARQGNHVAPAERLARGGELLSHRGIGFLGVKSTIARPIGPAERLWRWYRRHLVAAGRLILRESGADYRTHARRIIAAPAPLCDEIQTLLGV